MRNSFIRKNWRSIFIAASLITDIVAMALSGITAYRIGSLFPAEFEWDLKEVITRWAQFSSILFFFGLLLGLYRAAYHLPVAKQYLLALKSHFYSALAVVASFYIFHTPHFPRRFTFLYFMILPIFFLACRIFLNRLNLAAQKRGYGIHNALIFGLEEEGAEILERFQSIPELGYRIRGFIAKNENHAGKHQVYSFSQLNNVLMRDNIDRIFVPTTKLFTAALPELVRICKDWNIVLRTLSPAADELLRTAKVYDIVGITLYAPPRTKTQFIQRSVKRGFDIFTSILLLCLLSPVLLLTAMAIYLESGSPIIFRQRRARTKNGKPFNFYKFRSMIRQADQMKDVLFQWNESDGALFKLRDDPRVTRVGKIIRRLSIDELPQLFNVLKGDMSLVGPRPLPIQDFEKVEEGPEFWEAIKARESSRPGITGLWQISGRSNLGFREMVLLDLYYIENQSFLLDLEILFGTFPVMLFGKGAY